MPSSNASSTTKAGIIQSTDGERHIPSSTRADGSKRKQIKIRPGYRPPEDVEVYKNRTAEAWKTRGTGGIPGAASVEDTESKTSNKNVKRREARKKAKAASDTVEDDEEPGNVQAASATATTNGTLAKEDWRKPAVSIEVDPEAEREKQTRNLKKKLRQARELKEKKDSGGNLLPEQFEKVIKINELIRQLDSLGLDANGEPKE
ncbi:MAG: hypothetical protein M1812_002818 [Candelaria pacifica]|nr:MAG: hypothetical protein M1812_002818 [Candelaria pacifica]